MKAADQFHVGIVVHDLDATLIVSTPVVLPDGEATLDLLFTYSRTEPRVG